MPTTVVAPDLVAVEPLPIPKSWTHVFFRARIGAHEFMGMMGVDGPSVSRARGSSQAHLGSVTRIVDSSDERGEMKGWYIAKYGPAEPRISLDDLSAEERITFLRVFGLQRAEAYRAPLRFEADILNSRAFAGLPAWVKAHKTAAARCAERYLEWYSWAQRQLSQENTVA